MSTDLTVHFTLSEEDFKNTVISGPSLEPLYYVETKKSMLHSEPTYLYRRDERGGKVLVAKIEFHTYKGDKIALYGEERKLDDLLPRHGLLKA